MTREFTQAELEAYLDEALTAAEMAEVEAQIRERAELMRRLQAIHERRDAGMHSLGEIWRRHRVSCADRETFGSYLLGVLPPDAGGLSAVSPRPDWLPTLSGQLGRSASTTGTAAGIGTAATTLFSVQRRVSATDRGG